MFGTMFSSTYRSLQIHKMSKLGIIMVIVSIFIRDYQGDLMVNVIFETYLGEPRSPFDPSQQQRPPEDHGADKKGK